MVARMSLRQRNRLEAMRLVQSSAVAMFEDHGFDTTTIEAIAEVCDLSPSTIYRHFGTKEQIVLWDEREPLIDQELAERLGRQPTIHAFRDAVVVALAERVDRDLFLRRLKLTYGESSIWGAAAQQDQRDRLQLAAAIAAVDGLRQATLSDEFVAAVCLAALDVALDNWQRDDGRADLADLIDLAVASAVALD